ncbi:MAG TPA: hypothetical protein VFX65_08925, partial [Candidatus Limnocylindrales bacterium]|nr:hypothetical protein [Candidatus Limnocylindrales bacterium]
MRHRLAGDGNGLVALGPAPAAATTAPASAPAPLLLALAGRPPGLDVRELDGLTEQLLAVLGDV